jgi:hypothetical protein
MALGKQVGDFSLKATSVTVSPGPGTALTIQVNYEGPATGEAGAGVLIGTLMIVGEPGAKSGTWQWYGLMALNAGGSFGSQGRGNWEESGPHRWRYRGTNTISTGQQYAVEAEGNLAERAVTGRFYEWG